MLYDNEFVLFFVFSTVLCSYKICKEGVDFVGAKFVLLSYWMRMSVFPPFCWILFVPYTMLYNVMCVWWTLMFVFLGDFEIIKIIILFVS